MTTTSPPPWAPPTGGGPSLPPPPASSQWGPPASDGPALPPPPAPPPGQPAPPRRRGRGKVLAAAAVVIFLATIASTAAITYALTSRSAEAPAAPAAPEPTATDKPAAPTAAETKAAKDTLCSVFDLTTRGVTGTGGVRNSDGEVNTPVVLRALGSVAAVQNAIVPALDDEFSSIARKYVDTNLALSNAAMARRAFGEVADLTRTANAATSALSASCGLKY